MIVDVNSSIRVIAYLRQRSNTDDSKARVLLGRGRVQKDELARTAPMRTSWKNEQSRRAESGVECRSAEWAEYGVVAYRSALFERNLAQTATALCITDGHHATVHAYAHRRVFVVKLVLRSLISLQHSMQPTYQGSVQLQGKGLLFHKWKSHFCAIFPTNQYGKARLEIYANEANFSAAKNGKSVLLADCISIRPVALTPNNPNEMNGLQLQLNNGTVMLMCLNSPEETHMWQQSLSRAAFPDQHQTTSIAQVGSPTPLPSPAVEMPSPVEESTYDVPWDLNQFHVLLITNNGSLRAKIPEGNYDLCFKDSLLLKDGIRGVEAWGYDDITWFGYGDSCFAFQVLDVTTFEFKCSRPTNVFEGLRTHLRMKNDVSATPFNLTNNYLVSYVPYERRRNSSVNGDDDIDRNRSYGGQQMQKITSSSSFMSQVPQSSPRDPNISVDSHHSEKVGNTQASENKSRRFSFFRRSKKEKKQKPKPTDIYKGQGRADFEQSAQYEWGMYQRPNQHDMPPLPPLSRPPEYLQTPNSPPYVNLPPSNYNYGQQYNGESFGLSDSSPPPPMDPRSPRVIQPTVRFELNQQADMYPSAKPPVPAKPNVNVNGALAFKRQLEHTIAARKASRDASPPIPRLPPIAENPQSREQQPIIRRRPSANQRSSDPRLRDSVVSEPPSDFVIDARMSQRQSANYFQFPSNGHAQYQQNETEESNGIPLISSQTHKPKHVDAPRMKIAQQESLIH